MRFFGLTLLILSLAAHAQNLLDGVEEGDLLFVSPYSGNPITEVTRLNDSICIDHVAICHHVGGAKGPLYLIEAIGKGVCLTPADSFLLRNQHSVIYAAHVEGTDIYATIKKGLHYVGHPYDPLFQMGDSALYCSELVQICYTDLVGQKIFSTIPMTFRDNEGNIPYYWIKFYALYNLSVPEGEPGTNPAQLFRHPAIQVYSIIDCSYHVEDKSFQNPFIDVF